MIKSEHMTSDVSVAARALARGEAVVFPTDTVCGLGVAVEAAASPDVLFEIKEREAGKPIAWLVGGVEDLARYGAEVPEVALELARRHWPGPLTLVVRASDAVPAAFRGSDGSIGLRMPNSPAALALIRELGCPIAATSANIAGDLAPSCVFDLDARIASRVSCVYAGFANEASPDSSDYVFGAVASGEASTVVSFLEGFPKVVREGAVTMEDVRVAEAAAGFGNLPCEDAGAVGECAVIREELSFPSSDGVSAIHARWWLPASVEQGVAPTAVVQLVHGMAEHIARYDEFAAYLAARGLAVCGHDHIGHGRSVSSVDDLGCLPPRTGADIMVADAHLMRGLAAERFAVVPHVVFGHSMGSFVVRAYVAQHGQGLAAAIVCGTGNQSLALSKAGNALANMLCSLRGPRSTSRLIHNMAVGAYGKAVPNARTPHDWISVDPAVVDAYAADPLCGYMFSVGGYAALTSLTAEVVTEQCVAQVRKDLPLLYIAGAQDPVGDFGRGVYAAAKLAEDAGALDVTTIIYGGMRHEVLNEPDREQVFADVFTWIQSHL